MIYRPQNVKDVKHVPLIKRRRQASGHADDYVDVGESNNTPSLRTYSQRQERACEGWAQIRPQQVFVHGTDAAHVPHVRYRDRLDLAHAIDAPRDPFLGRAKLRLNTAEACKKRAGTKT